jgi:hypothetical protein
VTLGNPTRGIPKDDKKTAKIELVHVTDSQFVVENAKEELEQVGKSYAATSKGRLTLFYNTISNGDVLNATRMTQLCADNGSECRHMLHYDEGGEDKTLQRLHEFCQDQDDDFRVSYIHSKGPFHQFEDGRNDRWRLYNDVPSRTSWIWKWFPDGERWREGAELYGKNVVEILNGPEAS